MVLEDPCSARPGSPKTRSFRRGPWKDPTFSGSCFCCLHLCQLQQHCSSFDRDNGLAGYRVKTLGSEAPESELCPATAHHVSEFVNSGTALEACGVRHGRHDRRGAASPSRLHVEDRERMTEPNELSTASYRTVQEAGWQLVWKLEVGRLHLSIHVPEVLDQVRKASQVTRSRCSSMRTEGKRSEVSYGSSFLKWECMVRSCRLQGSATQQQLSHTSL